MYFFYNYEFLYLFIIILMIDNMINVIVKKIDYFWENVSGGIEIRKRGVVMFYFFF